MPWIKDNVSYLDHQVRANHPNTSFPAPLTQEVLADFGYTWEEPATVEPQPAPRVIRDWEFRNRFTQAQLVGIMRAAMAGDDNAAILWLALSTASDGVDLDKPEHVTGVSYVAQAYPALGIDPQVILG